MPAVSLFTEAIQRAAKLEEELKAAHERIRNLEIALTAARRDKVTHPAYRTPAQSFAIRGPETDLNTLSEDDVRVLFREHKQEAATKPKWWQLFSRNPWKTRS